jgi:hypothetical protein
MPCVTLQAKKVADTVGGRNQRRSKLRRTVDSVFVSHRRAVSARWFNSQGEVDANKGETELESKTQMLAGSLLKREAHDLYSPTQRSRNDGGIGNSSSRMVGGKAGRTRKTTT